MPASPALSIYSDDIENELSNCSTGDEHDVLYGEASEQHLGGITIDEELQSVDSENDLLAQNPNNNGDDGDDDDWIYETGSSTEEPDTEWDTKREADVTVGLDTIIDNVDQSLGKEKLIAMSERYTNPTIVAMFLLYTKHLISVDAYSDLVTIVQQPWFEPGLLPRSLKGNSCGLYCAELRFTCVKTVPAACQFASYKSGS